MSSRFAEFLCFAIKIVSIKCTPGSPQILTGNPVVGTIHSILNHGHCHRHQDKVGAVDLPPAAGLGYDIELKDVAFGYREEQLILQASSWLIN